MAKHMAAKKNNIVRNASVAAVASAALVGSIAPANAFAAAPVVSASDAPVLSSYENSTSTAGASVSNFGPKTQSSDSQPVDTKNLSGDRQQVLDAAYNGIGGSYVWGGKSYKAWDCSGFVSYVYAQAGINLTAYTYTMASELRPTSTPQPGDIVFTNGYAHVGIYVGDGKMISALNPPQGTELTAVDGGGFMPVDGYYTAF